MGVRFDKETLDKLDVVTNHYQEARVESLRRGVEKLYSEIKKQRFVEPVKCDESLNSSKPAMDLINAFYHSSSSVSYLPLDFSAYFSNSFTLAVL